MGDKCGEQLAKKNADFLASFSRKKTFMGLFRGRPRGGYSFALLSKVLQTLYSKRQKHPFLRVCCNPVEHACKVAARNFTRNPPQIPQGTKNREMGKPRKWLGILLGRVLGKFGVPEGVLVRLLQGLSRRGHFSGGAKMAFFGNFYILFITVTVSLLSERATGSYFP